MIVLQCARCRQRKGVSGFAVFAQKRDRLTGKVLYAERDDTCRKCRAEVYRGVPDEIVRWRTKEASLIQQLARVRAKIRTLLHPPPLTPEDIDGND